MSTPSFGPILRHDGVLFRLWAPTADNVELVIEGRDPVAMSAGEQGYVEAFVASAGAGTRYQFRIGGLDVADCASREQVHDAIGWSAVRAALPARTSRALRPWHEAVIAEVHVGTASPEGTFTGLKDRLGYFRDAGYTALEIMPVNEFVGMRNWGYDGVLIYAPDRSYGSPADLRGLVDAAHALDLSIIMDVVYNHFGPVGNFLHLYAKSFVTDRFKTPWGSAMALDDPTVRAFFIENVRMWLDEYDVDGLRFDAVHAFRTEAAGLFLDEIAATSRAIKPDAYLILENDENGAGLLVRDEDERPTRFTAQWNDDVHHALHVATTGETAGYYGDYAEDPAGKIARGLAEGFIYQGEPSRNKKGQARGEPSAHLPPLAFANFVQNHDQIGNRPLGDRLVSMIPPDRSAFLRFVLMLSPQIPLLFQGEEAEVDTPFPFFCDFEGDLADAIRTGRRQEFKPFFETHAGSVDDLPDPLAQSTFDSAKMPWDRLGEPRHRTALAGFQALARSRRELIWPLLASHYRGSSADRAGLAHRIEWRFEVGTLVMVLNPGQDGAVLTGPQRPADVEIGTVEVADGRVGLGAWSAAVWVER